jgi:hypothetical protein
MRSTSTQPDPVGVGIWVGKIRDRLRSLMLQSFRTCRGRNRGSLHRHAPRRNGPGNACGHGASNRTGLQAILRTSGSCGWDFGWAHSVCPPKPWVGVLAASTTLLAASPAHAATFTGPPSLVARAYHWQAEAKIPLGNETVQLTPDNGTVLNCLGAAGCSTPGITIARDRGTFYFEMGHQDDWQNLTGPDRRNLALHWHAENEHWADTPAALAVGNENGLEGIFATYFEACAWGKALRFTSVTDLQYAGPPMAMPSANSGSYSTCGWIVFQEALQ